MCVCVWERERARAQHTTEIQKEGENYGQEQRDQDRERERDGFCEWTGSSLDRCPRISKLSSSVSLFLPSQAVQVRGTRDYHQFGGPWPSSPALIWVSSLYLWARLLPRKWADAHLLPEGKMQWSGLAEGTEGPSSDPALKGLLCDLEQTYLTTLGLSLLACKMGRVVPILSPSQGWCGISMRSRFWACFFKCFREKRYKSEKSLNFICGGESPLFYISWMILQFSSSLWGVNLARKGIIVFASLQEENVQRIYVLFHSRGKPLITHHETQQGEKRQW